MELLKIVPVALGIMAPIIAVIGTLLAHYLHRGKHRPTPTKMGNRAIGTGMVKDRKQNKIHARV
jgi:hypothetical protein